MNRRVSPAVWVTTLLGLPVLFVCLCGGMVFPLQLAYYLPLGWIHFLGRVVPQLRPDPAAVATGVACLAAVVGGTHAVGRWLYPALRTPADGQPPPEWPWRWTLRVVGLVVLMFTAGTAAVGVVHQTGWLLTSPEPLFTGGIRGAAARARSQSHLKQMGLAAYNFHDANDRFPASTFTPDGRPLHSWQTQMLPYLEQEPLFKRIDLAKPWDHPANAEPMRATIPQFIVPMMKDDWVNGRGVSHYAANVLVLGGDRPRNLRRDFPLGLSNTVFYGEATTNPRAWGDPLNWRDPRLGANRHPDGFGGPFRGGVNVGMGDGSVRFVRDAAWPGVLTGQFEE